MNMSKAKTAAEKATATAETNFKPAPTPSRPASKRPSQAMTPFWATARTPPKPMMKSATVAGKGIETLNSEIYSYSKDAIEDSIAASKAILGSKSVHEAFELQTDFAKSAFEVLCRAN